MIKNNQETKFFYDDDEVDLKDVLMILWLKKKFIIVLTATIAILAGIYAHNIKPIYEAKALVEIGKYNYNASINVSSNANQALVDSVPELVGKLSVLFIDINNDKGFTITDIATKAQGLISIKSNAESNELAVNGVNEVVAYIQSKHKIIIDEIIGRKKSEIKTITAIINSIQNKEVNNISDNRQSLLSIVADNISISNLLEKKQLAESLLLPYNYKNSEIVGEVITSNIPVSPNLRLFIIIAFFGGFIFSIFLVLIMSVFKSEYEKAIA